MDKKKKSEFDLSARIKSLISEKGLECSICDEIIDIDAALSIKPSEITQIISFLKNSKELRFSSLTDLFATDFLGSKANRFEVNYLLLSIKLNKRIIIRCNVKEGVEIPTITQIYPSACWYEREIMDMYGINFAGNKDKRRILTDYGFTGHPLRKDFPLTGHIQLKYNQKKQSIEYGPVVLDQKYRDFDCQSPWQGIDYNMNQEIVLPGDEKASKD